MKKRFMAILLAAATVAAMCGGALAGCSPSDDGADGNTYTKPTEPTDSNMQTVATADAETTFNNFYKQIDNRYDDTAETSQNYSVKYYTREYHISTHTGKYEVRKIDEDGNYVTDADGNYVYETFENDTWTYTDDYTNYGVMNCIDGDNPSAIAWNNYSVKRTETHTTLPESYYQSYNNDAENNRNRINVSAFNEK